MAVLVDLGVAAPHQNYDVTSRASNDAGFLKNFSTRVFSPKCTILPSYSKIGAGRVFLVHPNVKHSHAQTNHTQPQETIKNVLLGSHITAVKL